MIYTLTLNPAIDRTYLVDGVAINAVNRVGSITTEWGGKGINVARALCRSGVPVKAVAVLGGQHGMELAEGVRAEGIDLIPLEIEGNTRVNHVFVDVEGSSIKFNEPGPTLTTEEISQVFALVESLQSDEDIWVLSGSLPPGVPSSIYRELIETIHAQGGKVFLDTNGTALQKGLDGLPDWIKPNYEEAKALFPNEQSPERLCELLRHNGAATVLLSLGADGIMCSSANGFDHVQAPALDVKNPVAAGDAAVAGFLFGFTQQMNAVECTKWAAAFGTAAAASHANCFQAMSEVTSFYDRIKMGTDI